MPRWQRPKKFKCYLFKSLKHVTGLLFVECWAFISAQWWDNPATHWDSRIPALSSISDRAHIRALAVARVDKASQCPIQGYLRWAGSHLMEHPVSRISIPSSLELFLLQFHHPGGSLLMLRSHRRTPGNLQTALSHWDPLLRLKWAQIHKTLCDQLQLR